MALLGGQGASPSSCAPHGVPAASDRALLLSIPSLGVETASEGGRGSLGACGCHSCAMHGRGSAAAAPALRRLQRGGGP